jgi:hypothetical protein
MSALPAVGNTLGVSLHYEIAFTPDNHAGALARTRVRPERPMTWIDAAIMVVLLFFIVTAFQNGFIRETISIAAAIAGVVLASFFCETSPMHFWGHRQRNDQRTSSRS